MNNKLTKLNYCDTIEKGVYAGLTVKDCISIYGRRSIIEILKYYNLDEQILRAYHFHSEGKHKDKPNGRKSKGVVAKEASATITQDYGEERPGLHAEERHLKCMEKVGEYCLDDIWMMNINSDINDPWEINEMQYPWEMAKSCYEYDPKEEEVA